MNNLYTVKQVAELLGVSKQAVQKVINKKNIECKYVEKNTYFYSYNDIVSVILKIDRNFDISLLNKVVNTSTTETTTTANSTTKNDNLKHNPDEDIDSSPPTQQEKGDNADNENNDNRQLIEVLENTIALFQNQLIEKDKQIEELTKIIQADKIIQAEQIKSITALTEENQKKKSFFHKLFNKNKQN
jgi:DNA-binding transcriptional MerR regulator